MQTNSEHPLAKAIVEHARTIINEEEPNKSNFYEAHDFQSVTGQGIRAVVNSKQVVVGNRQMMIGSGISIPGDVDKYLQVIEQQVKT